MDDIIFTKESVKNLWENQFNRRMHPYTCLNRGDGNHIEIGSDLGMLIPTIYGWICPFCNYTQNWAHEVSKNESQINIDKKMPKKLSGLL